jgi:hypothetical protein
MTSKVKVFDTVVVSLCSMCPASQTRAAGDLMIVACRECYLCDGLEFRLFRKSRELDSGASRGVKRIVNAGADVITCHHSE